MNIAYFIQSSLLILLLTIILFILVLLLLSSSLSLLSLQILLFKKMKLLHNTYIYELAVEGDLEADDLHFPIFVLPNT